MTTATYNAYFGGNLRHCRITLANATHNQNMGSHTQITDGDTRRIDDAAPSGIDFLSFGYGVGRKQLINTGKGDRRCFHRSLVLSGTCVL